MSLRRYSYCTGGTGEAAACRSLSLRWVKQKKGSVMTRESSGAYDGLLMSIVNGVYPCPQAPLGNADVNGSVRQCAKQMKDRTTRAASLESMSMSMKA